MKKIIFIVFSSLVSLLLLIYMLWPGPIDISNFAALPDSAKSRLSGDTVQVTNVVAYFSNNYRDFATNFYRNNFQVLNKFPFRPLRLNYPPEDAYTYIKDQTMSTYLEEYVYPLRNSIFINGLEPLDASGNLRYRGAGKFTVEEGDFETKIVLRYYPSSILVRVLVWLGINVSVVLLWWVGRKVIYEV